MVHEYTTQFVMPSRFAAQLPSFLELFAFLALGLSLNRRQPQRNHGKGAREGFLRNGLVGTCALPAAPASACTDV